MSQGTSIKTAVEIEQATCETHRPQGKFITFEGTEGVGKTTAINQLCQRLDAQGMAYVRTREPGGSPFAEQLRDMLLNPELQINDDTELLLMFAARSDHLNQVIEPALNAGKWVICDRFIDSTVAYQGYGRGFGETNALAKINHLIQHFVPRLPDVTLWLDLPIVEGMTRAAKRSQLDRFEQEKMDFFSRVHEGFMAQHQQYPQRVQRIDANDDIDTVAARVWQAIEAQAIEAIV